MCVCVCACACVCVCVCVCVCMCVHLLSSCFFSPEVVNAQAKLSGDHVVLIKYLNPHVIAITTETEGGKKCQFEMCILTDTQHSSIHVLISYFSVS